MDLPVHIAAGALMGNAVLYIDRKFPHVPTQKRRIQTGIACFFLGVISHLVLDAVPHYDWLFYITIFKPLPYHWLIPQVIVALPVLLFVYHFMKDYRMLAVISVLGGIYPDIEKFAYFDLHFPRFLMLLRQHSCYLTPWSSWELKHETFLIILEIWLLTGLLAIIYWMARCRRPLLNRKHIVQNSFQAVYKPNTIK